MWKSKNNYREILAIGTPVMIGQLGTIVLGFADTLMIGHHSTNELAAAGLVNNIFNLALLFYLGFSYGLTPIVGKLFGMGRTQDIGVKVKNSLLANMLIALLLMVVMGVLYFNLHRIGQPEELLPLIRPYFIVQLVSIPFVGLFDTFKQLFDGITRTKVAMWAMIGGNLVNILFNWLLIYGVGGFPELGLLGAGISTMGSRVLMAVALVIVLMFEKRSRPYRQGIAGSRINLADFKEMNRLGWPLGLQLGMETAAFSLSCVLAGWLGIIPLAAHQIMITISVVFYLVSSGLASAVSIRISMFVGKHDFAAVRANAADGFKLVLMFIGTMSVILLIFRNHVGLLFNDNPEVNKIVAVTCLVLVAYQFSDALQYCYANALRGIACVKPMVYYAFVAYFVVNLPLAYVFGFPLGLGMPGIWLAFLFGLSVAGILYLRKFRIEVRKMENAAH